MTSFRLEDLARAADVSPRTVRYYVQRGLLPPPEFRGKDTTYGAEHLSRLVAIKRLQQARLPLEEIAARLASASPAELERLAAEAEPLSETPSPSSIDPPPEPALAGERWERFVLAPGLALHLEGDASAETRRLAQQILELFGPNPKPRTRSSR
ncbi:HTH-type transcriptional regulator cueR [Minicystis rosea]|nr:HTH-type transcriptional regulator cueR [Minicystis rosea]